jgi:hypothetical protein
VENKRRWLGVVGGLMAGYFAGCGGGSSGLPAGIGHGIDGMHPGSPGEGGRAGNGMGGPGAGGGPSVGVSPPAFVGPAASLAPGTLCDRSGWCWYNTLPSGDAWLAIGSVGRTELWFGGDGADALHYQGGHWTAVPSPLVIDAIWGASSNDVWFAGFIPDPADVHTVDHAAIAHWDGTALTIAQTYGQDPVHDVWGSGPNDVYAVDFFALHHWDGVAWSTIPIPDGGQSLSGSGPNDVWLGGGFGLLHFDGAGWTLVPTLNAAQIGRVSAAGPNDLWVIAGPGGPFQDVEHFDGSNWTISFETMEPNQNLDGIYATSTDDVWVVGAEFVNNQLVGYVNHFDGTSWTRWPGPPGWLVAVSNVPGLGVFSVGFDGEMVRLEKTPALGFTELRQGPIVRLSGTFGTAPTDMWAVGDAGTVLHYDGRTVVSIPSGTTADLRDVWGSSPTDIWAVGTGGTVLHFAGPGFAPVASQTGVDLNAVFTARPGDAWIGGDAGTLLHWDGASLSPVSLPGAGPALSIRDLHGLAANDIWLSGSAAPGDSSGTVPAFVSHFDGTTWSPVQLLTGNPELATAPVVRIWELGPDDVWGATDRFAPDGRSIGFWHFDGTEWTGSFMLGSPATFMFPNAYGGSFVFGPRDRWQVGRSGLWQRSTM